LKLVIGVTTSTRVARVLAMVGILKSMMRNVNASDRIRMGFRVMAAVDSLESAMLWPGVCI
jgi:hypothetical protein